MKDFIVLGGILVMIIVGIGLDFTVDYIGIDGRLFWVLLSLIAIMWLLINDAISKLKEKNKKLNQKILDLEKKIEDLEAKI